MIIPPFRFKVARLGQRARRHFCLGITALSLLIVGLSARCQTDVTSALQQQWDALLARYLTAQSQGEVKKSKEAALSLVELAQKTHSVQWGIIAHHNLGVALANECHSKATHDPLTILLGQKAVTAYAEALTLNDQSGDAAFQQKIRVVTNNAKAEMHKFLGEYELAQTHLQQSIAAATESNHPNLAPMLRNLGTLFFIPEISQGQKQGLLDYFEAKRPLFEAKEKWEAIAWCDYYLAISAPPQKAIATLRQSLILSDRFDAKRESDLRMSTLHWLEIKLLDYGSFLEALEVCNAEEGIITKVFSRNPSQHSEDLAECRNNKAKALLNLGEFEAALKEFGHALQPRGFSTSYPGWSLIERNKVLAEQCVRSQDPFDLTPELARKWVVGQSDLLVRAGMALRLGGELREKGFAKDAMALFRSVQTKLTADFASIKTSDASPLTALKRLFLGALTLESGEWKQAATILEQARQELSASGQDNALSFCLPLLAVAQEHAGQIEQAEQTFQQAILHFEEYLARVNAPERMGLFQFARAATLYADYAHLLASRGRFEAALLTAERVRGRGIAHQAVTVLAQAALTEEEKKTRRSLWLSDLTGKELNDLTSHSPKTLFLHYNLSREGVTLFAFGAGLPVRYWVLDKDSSSVMRQVNTWVKNIITKGPQSAEKSFATQLGKTLLAPLYKAKGLLSDGQNSRWKKLVIVPDSGLHNVPFAALVLPEPGENRLIDRFAFSVTASLRQRVRSLPLREAKRAFLIVSDPTGGKQRQGAKPIVAGKFNLDPLPEFGRMGAQLAKRFAGRVTYLPGKAATKSTVQRVLPEYALPFFLTHGCALSEHSGLSSYLALAPEPGNPRAGRLEAAEIISQPLAARMALLLACETAQGLLAGGEGSQGLVWAFWAAGCPSVMASLWEIDPSAASVLLPLFLDGLKKGLPKDEALRAAILKIRRDFTFPKEWAAFQIYGDPGVLTRDLQ